MGDLSDDEAPTLEALEGQAWQVLRQAYLRALCHDQALAPVELSEERQNEMLSPFFRAMEHETLILRQLLLQAAGAGQEILMARLREQVSDERVLIDLLEGGR